MLRIVTLCVLLAFSIAAAAQTPPPFGAKPPPDPSLGPPPKPKPKPMPRVDEIPELIAPRPIAGADPDPAVPPHATSIPILTRILSDLEQHKVEESLFAPAMVAAMRAHRESLIAYMETFGAFRELKYIGSVEPANPIIIAGRRMNVEEYESLHANGKMRWRFLIGPDGKVARFVSIRRAGE
jgi:hypothetical protein